MLTEYEGAAEKYCDYGDGDALERCHASRVENSGTQGIADTCRI